MLRASTSPLLPAAPPTGMQWLGLLPQTTPPLSYTRAGFRFSSWVPGNCISSYSLDQRSERKGLHQGFGVSSSQPLKSHAWTHGLERRQFHYKLGFLWSLPPSPSVSTSFPIWDLQALPASSFHPLVKPNSDYLLLHHLIFAFHFKRCFIFSGCIVCARVCGA